MSPASIDEYLHQLRQNDTETYYKLLERLRIELKKIGNNSDENFDYEKWGNNDGYHDNVYVPDDRHNPTDSDDHFNQDSFSLDPDVCNNNLTRILNYYDFTQLTPIKYIFIILYIVVIVISFVGNFMVIWTVTRNRHMRTVTNYYIRNLAVCDFLVATLVMPLKLLEYTAPCSWQVFAKDALCSVIYYILPVFVFASVLTLVAISLERCHAIVHPLNSFTMHSKTRTRLILLATWLIPVVVSSPYMYCRSYAFSIHSPYGTISRQICTDRFAEIDVAIYGEAYKQSGRFRKGFFIFIFIAMYLIPMIVIVTTCIRIAVCLLKPMDTDSQEESSYGMKMTRKRGENKRRVARMIITVAIAFIVCWTPFYLVSFVSQVQTVSFLKNSNFIFTMLATHLSGFLNSAINPFIYHFMSEKFRKSFTVMARSLFCCPQNILQRNQRRQYSWAMKCEEYYCQHRLQRQQSNSSHSQSNKDFAGGQGAVPRLKNYNNGNKNRQTAQTKLQQSKHSSSSPNNRHKCETSQKLICKPHLQGKSSSSSSQKNNGTNPTIVKNKQKTSLYCGPFCVCQCQGCSIQSSSSGPSSTHSQPYGGNIVHLKGQQTNTQTETQLSFGQQQQQNNGVSKGHHCKGHINNYIQMKGLHKANSTKIENNKQRENCTNVDSKPNGEKLKIFIDVPSLKSLGDEGNNQMIVACKNNLILSRSDSNIYDQDKDELKVDKETNGVSKSSRSSNHLVL